MAFDEMTSTMRSCMVQQWLDTKDGFGSGFSSFILARKMSEGKNHPTGKSNDVAL
jgi:hypothetical protein